MIKKFVQFCVFGAWLVNGRVVLFTTVTQGIYITNSGTTFCAQSVSGTIIRAYMLCYHFLFLFLYLFS